MIKKRIIVSLFVVFIISVSSKVSIAQSVMVDSVDQIVFDTIIKQEILYGYCSPDIRWSPVFIEEYENSLECFSISADTLYKFKDTISKFDITIVFGSWCSDSQREVPRFIEILWAMDYPMDKLTIIALNRNKLVNEIDISQMDIKYVPTFIFKRDNIEIGRIIESPKISLIEDIKVIIKNNI